MSAVDVDLRVFADYDRDVREEADVVVVGRDLAEPSSRRSSPTRASVVLIEEGLRSRWPISNRGPSHGPHDARGGPRTAGT